MALAGELVGVARELEQDLLRHHLGGPGEVEMPLLEPGFRGPRRPAEEPAEPVVGHAEAAEEIKVIQVQPERPVRLHIHQLVVNRLHMPRLTIGREAHQLVFPRVDPEAAVGCERRVEQPQ